MQWQECWDMEMPLFSETLRAFVLHITIRMMKLWLWLLKDLQYKPYSTFLMKRLKNLTLVMRSSSRKTAAPIKEILEPRERKACSFERIYFSRGSDKEIYQERKELGKLLFPQILKAIDHDIRNTVFSYIPNTAETSFFGLVKEAQNYLNTRKKNKSFQLAQK